MNNNPMKPTSSLETSRAIGGSDCYKKAIWYPLLGLALALLVPESFVADSETLKRIIAEAGHWIPAVNNISVISDFPLTTGLYLTVMWLLLPFAVWWWLVKMPMVDALPSLWPLVRLLIMNTVFIALLASLFYWFPIHPNAQGLSLHAGRSGAFLGSIAHFRVGLGLGLGALFYVLSLFVMIWLRTAWLCAIWLHHKIGN